MASNVYKVLINNLIFQESQRITKSVSSIIVLILGKLI
jgi:hypothetical protein